MELERGQEILANRRQRAFPDFTQQRMRHFRLSCLAYGTLLIDKKLQALHRLLTIPYDRTIPINTESYLDFFDTGEPLSSKWLCVE